MDNFASGKTFAKLGQQTCGAPEIKQTSRRSPVSALSAVVSAMTDSDTTDDGCLVALVRALRSLDAVRSGRPTASGRCVLSIRTPDGFAYNPAYSSLGSLKLLFLFHSRVRAGRRTVARGERGRIPQKSSGIYIASKSVLVSY